MKRLLLIATILGFSVNMFGQASIKGFFVDNPNGMVLTTSDDIHAVFKGSRMSKAVVYIGDTEQDVQKMMQITNYQSEDKFKYVGNNDVFGTSMMTFNNNVGTIVGISKAKNGKWIFVHVFKLEHDNNILATVQAITAKIILQ